MSEPLIIEFSAQPRSLFTKLLKQLILRPNLRFGSRKRLTTGAIANQPAKNNAKNTCNQGEDDRGQLHSDNLRHFFADSQIEYAATSAFDGYIPGLAAATDDDESPTT